MLKTLIRAALLLLVACAGTNFSWDNARKVQVGMTPQEVEALMGPPYGITSVSPRTIWVWSWASGFGGAKSMTVTFVDGKVASVPEIPPSF